MARIAVDYDSTTVDLLSVACDEINMAVPLGPRCKPSDIATYDYLQKTYGDWTLDLWSKNDIYDKVLPYDGAVEFLNKLRERHEVVILTSCRTVELFEAKKVHCQKYFGDVPIMMSYDKYKDLGEDDILIDDYFRHCSQHDQKNNGKSILFNINDTFPYVSMFLEEIKTRDNIFYARTYDEILLLVESLTI